MNDDLAIEDDDIVMIADIFEEIENGTEETESLSLEADENEDDNEEEVSDHISEAVDDDDFDSKKVFYQFDNLYDYVHNFAERTKVKFMKSFKYWPSDSESTDSTDKVPKNGRFLCQFSTGHGKSNLCEFQRCTSRHRN